MPSNSRLTFYLQLTILAVCGVLLGALALNFPYPSPVIRPFLAPAQRWPTAQIRHWVEIGSFDRGYLEFFARDPERNPPPGDNIVAPSDGVVQDVRYRDGKTFLIIGLSFWDVHVVRSASAGMVKSVETEGYYVTRDTPKNTLKEAFYLRGKTAPVQSVIVMTSKRGELTERLITSYWASRLKVWVAPSEFVTKGQRVGRILLGSTVVLELSGKLLLRVKAGERVVGGETIVYSGASRS